MTENLRPISVENAEPPYLATLNGTQRDAVTALDGPVLVLAGAGTGKTRVLTTRLAHLLVLGKARPWEILAVTFTNKAAREMRERVAALLGHEIEGWWVGTFHALGARILRAHAEAVGLKSNFTIIDTDDQIRLVKQLVEGFEIDDKRWPARNLVNIIQRWKDRALTPETVGNADDADAADGRMVELYVAYQERLRTLNAADFGDLLLHVITVFQKDAEVLARYQDKFRYLLVDEYQDTNVAQYLWLRLLAQKHRNICCVGDDDQSIYSWRGAEVGNILRFESDFPGAVIVRLERNYRSTPHILGAASGLIANNESRLGKTLWTDLNDGEQIRVRGVWDGEEEARVVGEEIEALHSQKQPLNGMAILVRAGFQTREFEDRLITLALPYRVVGGLRFYERQEIRDAVAYLRVIAQPDDDLAFERIVNLPKRGIGDATVRTLHLAARADGVSMTAATRRLLETDEFKPKVRATLTALMDDFDRWREMAEDTHQGELASTVLDESGYTQMWRDKARSDRSPDAAGRLDNLRELIAALEDFDSLDAFLEHVSLVMENDNNDNDDKVTLMTLHGAKGLEFDTVFLTGWEEGLFPHQRALDEGGSAALEEERRLAYVGITRARKRAMITFAANRRVYNQWQSAIPSRFIDELPTDHVAVETQPGLYGGNAGLGDDGDSAYTQNAYGGFRRRTRRDPLRDAGSWQTRERPQPTKSYTVGERVFHQKFGYGTISGIDGNKLEIAFEKAGTKKVMASFVEDA
ncbi:MAG: UvrD-helicase domain-containing protein [Rhodospirillales bacterium]